MTAKRTLCGHGGRAGVGWSLAGPLYPHHACPNVSWWRKQGSLIEELRLCLLITISAQLYSSSGDFNIQGRSYGYHMSHLLLDRREGVLHGLGVKGQIIPVIHGVAPDLAQLAPALQKPFHLRQQCKGRVDVLTLT